MVAQIVGAYLVESGVMSRGQLLIVNKERRRIRASLGLVAISEGLMSADEVKEMNEALEAAGHLSDRAFADYVVEKEYLSMGQVRSLASKQSDPFLCFAQALEKQGIIGLEALEALILESPFVNNEMELEDLKSDDSNSIIPLFIPAGAEKYIDIAEAAMYFLNRRVDANIYPQQAFLAERLAISNGVSQYAEGEKDYFVALAAVNAELATVAGCYMSERYEEVNDEVLELVGGILNTISSSYIAELAQDHVLDDLAQPQSYMQVHEITAEEMLVLPLVVKYETFYLIISMAKDIKIV
jgi:CheY-specific phosphatase CheX